MVGASPSRPNAPPWPGKLAGRRYVFARSRALRSLGVEARWTYRIHGQTSNMFLHTDNGSHRCLFSSMKASRYLTEPRAIHIWHLKGAALVVSDDSIDVASPMSTYESHLVIGGLRWPTRSEQANQLAAGNPCFLTEGRRTSNDDMALVFRHNNYKTTNTKEREPGATSTQSCSFFATMRPRENFGNTVVANDTSV